MKTRIIFVNKSEIKLIYVNLVASRGSRHCKHRHTHRKKIFTVIFHLFFASVFEYGSTKKIIIGFVRNFFLILFLFFFVFDPVLMSEAERKYFQGFICAYLLHKYHKNLCCSHKSLTTTFSTLINAKWFDIEIIQGWNFFFREIEMCGKFLLLSPW